jgi:hypothetical protein
MEMRTAGGEGVKMLQSTGAGGKLAQAGLTYCMSEVARQFVPVEWERTIFVCANPCPNERARVGAR